MRSPGSRWPRAPCFRARPEARAEATAEPDLARGAELFQLCAQCHGAEAHGNEMFLAPSIAGLPQWYVVMQLHEFRQGYRGHHFDDISGMRMRPMSLTLPATRTS